MAKWYFLIDGEQFGPVESAVLRRIADSGRLKPHDKVRRADSKEWFEANQVKGHFSPTATSQTTSKPVAKTPVASPQIPAKSATTNRRGKSWRTPAVLMGCGCLLVPLGGIVLLLVVGIIGATVDPDELRQWSEAQNRAAAARGKERAAKAEYGALSSFDEVPPPIEAAIADGKEVWALEDHAKLHNTTRDLMYVVIDHSRMEKLIVKFEVTEAGARLPSHASPHFAVSDSFRWEETTLSSDANNISYRWRLAWDGENATLTLRTEDHSPDRVGIGLQTTSIHIKPDTTHGRWNRTKSYTRQLSGNLAAKFGDKQEDPVEHSSGVAIVLTAINADASGQK